MYLKHVTDNVVNGLRHVLEVLLAHCTLGQYSTAGCKIGVLTATDGGSTGLEQINVVLVLESVDLLGGKASVGEHAVL